MFAELWPATFPSGQGSDFAGVVAELGSGVDGFAIGDEVIGFTDHRGSHAEFVVAEATSLTPKPSGVSWEQAGALFVAGTIAYAAVRSVSLKKGDTVVVSGAAGGVGSLAVQLAVKAGAKVIGLASKANHEWLAAHGVIRSLTATGSATGSPGPPAGGWTRSSTPSVAATSSSRSSWASRRTGSKGNADAASADVLAELAGLINAGEMELVVAKVYPLEQVRDAYRELEQRHTRGKIVLRP